MSADDDCTDGHAVGCRHVEHPAAPLAEVREIPDDEARVEAITDVCLDPGAAVDEIARLRRDLALQEEVTGQVAARAVELTGRDEAAKAVVEAWRERIAPARTQRMEGLVRLFIGDVLADRLDALARARDDG